MPSQPIAQINDFSANSSEVTLMGSAVFNGPDVQLTDINHLGEVGTVFYNQALSVGAGLTFQFDYTSGGGNNADGLTLLLVDADKTASTAQIMPGTAGGGLAYQSNTSQSGITNGFLGIGFDTFGNYETNAAGNGGNSAPVANSVGLRAAGNGQTGYGFLTSNVYDQGIDGDRTAIVKLTKVNETQERIQVMIAPTGTTNFETVIDTVLNQQLPSKFFAGFGGATGGSVGNHIIHNFTVNAAPVSLSLGAVTLQDNTTNQANPAYVNPGDNFTETFMVNNTGSTNDDSIVITDVLPANAVGETWTVTNGATTTNGTGSSIPVSLLAGTSATVTVSGRIDPNASAGNANHAITLFAGAGYDNETTSPTSSTSAIKVGQNGGGSVSLVAANQTVSDSDTAGVMPFSGNGGTPAAQVVDTYSDANNPNMETLTVSVSPSSGTLSGDNATYNASTGNLTSSGTTAQVQATLQSVVFTPIPHNTAPGTPTPVQITVKVVSTTTGNTTDSGNEPSATQVETVSVTGVHDTPTISGTAMNQAVGDNTTANPFGSAVVTDPDNTGATSVVTIVGGAAHGDFTAASSSGFTRAVQANGDVTYTETFAMQQNVGNAVQAALRGLVFQPVALVSTQANPEAVNFTVSVTDTAATPATGNASASLSVNDMTPPAAPTNLKLAPASDTGVQGDMTTSQAMPTITGNAEAGSTVSVYDGQNSLGTTTVDNTGNWTFTPATALSDGSHALSAVDTDEAGLNSPRSASYNVTVDTTPPTGQAVASMTSSGQPDVKAGQRVSFTLTTSEAVNVSTTGGTPYLTLSDGGTATYVAMPDATHLAFNYTVAAGENSADLTVTGLNVNGSTITDAAGNAINAASVANATGVATGITVDTVSPTVQSETSTSTTNPVMAGQVVTFTAATSEAVNISTVGGTPYLALNDGGRAVYTGQQDSGHLKFGYTVAAGDNTTDLVVTGFSPNGGAITDMAGNAIVPDGFSRATGSNTGIAVDTTAPTVTGEMASAASNAIMAGQTVTFTVATSEAVNVNTTGGVPFLTLDDGGMAMFTGKQNSGNLVFSYTVAAGQNTSALKVTGFSSNGGVITDAAGNSIVPGSFGTAPGATSAIVVDTIAPTASAITSSTSTGVDVVAAGQGVTFTVATSEAVNVATAGGTPYLTLNDGGRAVFSGQQDSGHLTFSYTAATGENTGDLTVTGLQTNGGAISDAAGNAIAAASFANAQGASTGVAVNTMAAPITYNEIYRFFNTTTGSHFYTGSADEQAQVHATRPDLVEETNAFQGVDKNSTSAEAVYRFFDKNNGEHFLTSSQAEVKDVMQTRPDMTYEGVDFYEHATQQAGDSAVYRFFDNSNGSHLYTADTNERAGLLTNTQFSSEGIAFYAPLTKT